MFDLASHRDAIRHTNHLALSVLVLFLAACGGGGHSPAMTDDPLPPDQPTEPTVPEETEPPAEETSRSTDLSPAAETPFQQYLRSTGIVTRGDILHMSTIFGETNQASLPTFRLQPSCSGVFCTFTEPTTGAGGAAFFSNSSAGTAESVGTKNGVTLTSRVIDLAGVTESLIFGAWMDHSGFAMQTDGLSISGIDVDMRYGSAGGDLTGTRLTGSATWSGLMVGTPVAGSASGDRLFGDATLTYDLGSASLDAAFTNITNLDRRAAHSTSAVRFSDVPVASDGMFESGSVGNQIKGGFYGPGHAEAAGVFEQSSIVGAFGAKR